MGAYADAYASYACHAKAYAGASSLIVAYARLRGSSFDQKCLRGLGATPILLCHANQKCFARCLRRAYADLACELSPKLPTQSTPAMQKPTQMIKMSLPY